MPDFKGRKDFPEVADDKIKIGDYSGMNRLSVVDIYSPKEEPELRDQIMEPVKGESNNYDSPILSQQPVIVLSDDESEEASLIKAIDGYVLKEQNDGYVTKAEVQKIIGSVLGKIPIVGDIAEGILSADTDETGGIAKKGKTKRDSPRHPDTPPGVIAAGNEHARTGLGLRGQGDVKPGPVTTIKPGDPEHEEMMADMAAKAAANRQQGHTQHRPLVEPLDKAGELQKIIGSILGKVPIVGGVAEEILSADTDETNQDLEKIIPVAAALAAPIAAKGVKKVAGKAMGKEADSDQRLQKFPVAALAAPVAGALAGKVAGKAFGGGDDSGDSGSTTVTIDKAGHDEKRQFQKSADDSRPWGYQG